MQPAKHGRKTRSRRMKYDAGKTFDEWTKKQRDTPRALQVGYRKHMKQHLSRMSHTHRIFFGFVLSTSYERTQASTDKKCYKNIEKGHLPVNVH
jgi:hypothetical protein